MSYWKWAASTFKIATFTVAELCRRIGDQSVDQSITTNVNRDKKAMRAVILTAFICLFQVSMRVSI